MRTYSLSKHHRTGILAAAFAGVLTGFPSAVACAVIVSSRSETTSSASAEPAVASNVASPPVTKVACKRRIRSCSLLAPRLVFTLCVESFDPTPTIPDFESERTVNSRHPHDSGLRRARLNKSLPAPGAASNTRHHGRSFTRSDRWTCESRTIGGYDDPAQAAGIDAPWRNR